MGKLSIVRAILKKPRAKQVFALYASLLLGLVVSVAVSAINVRGLGAEGYGSYRFLFSTATLVITCSTFGLFASSGRLLAISENQGRVHELLGAVVVIFCALFFFLAVLFWIFSWYVNELFDSDLGWLIRLSLPLMFMFPLSICLKNILKGLNRVYSIAAIGLLPRLLYLGYAYALMAYSELTLERAYLGFLGGSAIVLTVAMARLRPSFHGLSGSLVTIFRETRRYGFNAYIGILASVATMQLGGVMVAYFVDMKSAGFFLLARMLTMPLTQVSTAIGITFFKKFSNSRNIQRRVLLVVLVSALLPLIFFLLLIDDIVHWLYPAEFSVIVPFSYIMAVGATLKGVSGVLNNFIGAKGYGAYLRNGSLIRGAVIIIGYTIGINYYGVFGAATTVLVAGMVILAINAHYYRRILAEQTVG